MHLSIYIVQIWDLLKSIGQSTKCYSELKVAILYTDNVTVLGINIKM
jgi:hypothetical protein